jgi:hypothetical protein
VNSNQALITGAYAGKPNFFGTALGEVVAVRAGSTTSGWNGDSVHHAYSLYPWFRRGGTDAGASDAGIFATSNANGNANNGGVVYAISHRTILSGY